MFEHGGSRAGAGGHAPQGRRAPRALAWVAIGVTVVLVAGVLSAYAAYRDLFGKIHQVKVTGLGHRPPGYDHSLNLLVIGSDTRQGKNSRFGAHIAGQRSDTILVLHLAPGFKRAIVLSIPRDSVVPVLACPAAPGAPGQAAQPGQVEQINQTFAAGGPSCLWKTIEHTTQIRLDHFMELNFTGFEQVINDLGGVTICLPFAVHDPHSKLRLSSGLHHVMGPTALAYWRVRYIGQGSDLERIARDQYLMASVAQGVKHTNLLADPTKLYKVMSDIAASLTTDSGLTQGTLITLAQSLRNMPLRAVRFIEVPVVTYPANPNWVQWAPSASKLFNAIAHDRKPPNSGASHSHQPAPASASRTSADRTPRGQASHGTQAPNPSGSSPAKHHRRSGLPGLTGNYGGITAGANVCRDSGAFAGPLGGH